MVRFLVFTLAAPLMAFGDVAPGERRVGADRPGRSALIGLMAAALGLRRDDSRQTAFIASLALAVRVDAPGLSMTDYHTTQTAPAKRKRRFATRREELAIGKTELNTILSQRAYRADAAFTIAVALHGLGPFTLDAVAAALTRPLLPIHAGRRACPLGLPPGPLVLEAGTLGEAFAAYDEAQAARGRTPLLERFAPLSSRPRLIALDAELEHLLGEASVHRKETRRDQPGDRVRWQFSPRTEIIAYLEAAT